MELETLLKPAARNLKKEWSAFGLENIKASKLPHGIALKTSFETFQKQKVNLTGLMTPGINPQKTMNLIVDATFPLQPMRDDFLPAFCAFLQQSTGLLSPLALLMDIQGQQMVVRQSQIVSHEYQPVTLPMLEAANMLIPLLQKTVSEIIQKVPAPGEARQMADYVATSYYGALQK
ncbi:hypothetical protein M3P05_05415 [Sansalvadorimonas sp. 2012CJ34-2]|uniref:Uncharacterized protein n=1 Tax=Parendozoicomonas callyspongiae TaxID=2942213 RepID=A0ABT0PDE0_9GAMM|nr:hypothetical protein [Sansalvadorimonas sp. 2012CJ34-2]MCL6269384.1 hypothetical protein [Sansalvadorimonas sp. 2012CJ34-2]